LNCVVAFTAYQRVGTGCAVERIISGATLDSAESRIIRIVVPMLSVFWPSRSAAALTHVAFIVGFGRLSTSFQRDSCASSVRLQAFVREGARRAGVPDDLAVLLSQLLIACDQRDVLNHGSYQMVRFRDGFRPVTSDTRF
jgi:hypothetical protein